MKIYSNSENKNHSQMTISSYLEVDEVSLAKTISFTSWHTEEKGERG